MTRLRAARASLCALALVALAPPAPAAAQRVAPAEATVDVPARDPWLGEDKVRHFAASAAISALGYGAARIALDHDGAIGVAIGTAAVAGLLREVHDHRLGKPFSFRDLAWDALGIAAGWAWIREIQ